MQLVLCASVVVLGNGSVRVSVAVPRWKPPAASERRATWVSSIGFHYISIERGAVRAARIARKVCRTEGRTTTGVTI